LPTIDRNDPTPFYQQVYEQIARGIESGYYPAGKKLASIRECARVLGVSNTTIELAYQRLEEEGYVKARRGSGFTICEVSTTHVDTLDRYSDEYREYHDKLIEGATHSANESQPLFDFAYDDVDATTFPVITWARICREVFFSKGAEAACLYNDAQGLHEFREQIARYLNGEHGLNCTAQQIIVKPTTRDLVTEIMALFNPAETVFAMENPGYDEVGRRMRDRGFTLSSVTTYPYPTWERALEELKGANIVFTTPASQFPSNHTMPIEMRKNLVTWAKEHDAYIIDDEYGWDFHVGSSHNPPLATTDDSGHVITLGTFSNSFTPAVCLSYAVLPPKLSIQWRATRRGSHPQVPWQTQAAMALFMREDHWRAHIRKVRTSLRRKRELLTNAITTYMPDSVEVLEGTNSLFVLVNTHDGRSESDLIEAAAANDVRVYPTSRYWHGGAPADWNYVQIGYAGIPAEAIVDGVKALAEAWGMTS